jgi:serine/threonine protein kinase
LHTIDTHMLWQWVSEALDSAAVVGSGAFGEVRKVPLPDGRTVAAKICASARVHEPEVMALRALGAHPGIVHLLEAGQVRMQWVCVLEYVQGGDLAQFVQRLAHKSLCAPGKELQHQLLKYARDVARALCHVHACGFLHRDVKLTNVLVAGDTAKLCDFGLAMRVDKDGRATASRGGGTPGRVAPEQELPQNDDAYCLSLATDVWAFGVLLWQLMTGCAISHAMHAAAIRDVRDLLPAIGWSAACQELGNHFRHLLLVNARAYAWVPTMHTMYLVDWCLTVAPEARPTMAQVLAYLEGDGTFAAPPPSTPSTPSTPTTHAAHAAHGVSTSLAVSTAEALLEALAVYDADVDMQRRVDELMHAGDDMEVVDAVGRRALDLRHVLQLRVLPLPAKRFAEALVLASLRKRDLEAFGQSAALLAVAWRLIACVFFSLFDVGQSSVFLCVCVCCGVAGTSSRTWRTLQCIYFCVIGSPPWFRRAPCPNCNGGTCVHVRVRVRLFLSCVFV